MQINGQSFSRAHTVLLSIFIIDCLTLVSVHHFSSFRSAPDLRLFFLTPPRLPLSLSLSASASRSFHPVDVWLVFRSRWVDFLCVCARARSAMGKKLESFVCKLCKIIIHSTNSHILRHPHTVLHWHCCGVATATAGVPGARTIFIRSIPQFGRRSLCESSLRFTNRFSQLIRRAFAPSRSSFEKYVFHHFYPSIDAYQVASFSFSSCTPFHPLMRARALTNSISFAKILRKRDTRDARCDGRSAVRFTFICCCTAGRDSVNNRQNKEAKTCEYRVK